MFFEEALRISTKDTTIPIQFVMNVFVNKR
jgi:hypothetical protein